MFLRNNQKLPIHHCILFHVYLSTSSSENINKYKLVIMVRKLKYHEQKLLKKVDFISWQADKNLHEVKILKRFRIQKREDYTKYNKLARHIRELARKIKDIDPEHPFRIEQSALLLEKLYMMGLIPTKWDLMLCQKITASSFCKRRLPVIMVRNKMSQTVKMATQLIEQGHVRVGAEVIKDPAFLVTRNLQDFVTWVDTSAIRKHVLEYNDMRDDFELL
ncbi:U3 small nucleolar ribonucleoprotein protein IMP3 [Cephus cinctus]|uniref:U3 small nucleolar ribonucleoprotein protein IMP3 n=1 Tax=Cephus cinctus TaxID=211228 RepID=A0AAJ7BYQ9_CEPCN|nr:U3 small nucleolar ribonucleoprotein protein IMP3 [Cephus cinctus]